MNSIIQLVKKDIKSYFDQPTGFVLLVIFVVSTSYFFFRNALNIGEASLIPLFQIMPWFLSILVSATTMRLLAEEQRDGTLEILLTHPIVGWHIVFSKFLAGLIFSSIGIIITIGLPISLLSAGNLDIGAIIAQYIGAVLLTGSFVSIGIFTSSLTKNQIVAFIIGLSLILLLMIFGMPIITLAIPTFAANLLSELSPLTHFTGMVRGVLQLKDIIYFAAIISTFLTATYLSLKSKTLSHKSASYRNLQITVLCLVVISLSIGWFGRHIGGRIDLTASQLYTLSSATEQIVSELDDIVTITVFQSKQPPVQIAPITREVNHMLNDISAKSKGKVRIIRSYPDENPEDKIDAENHFIVPKQFQIETQGELKVTNGYLGLYMTYANKKEAITYIESLDGIEYRLMANLYRMTQKSPKTISFLTGHQEKERDAEMQSFRDILERHHSVETTDQSGSGQYLDLSLTDVLIIAGPQTQISLPEQDTINEYLSAGGKALILVDPIQIRQQTLEVIGENPTLEQYLREYGVQVNYDIVYDPTSNAKVQFASRNGVPVALQYPYWVRANTENSKISGGVETVVIPWSSSLELIPTSDKIYSPEFTNLIITTKNSVSGTIYSDLFPQQNMDNSIGDSLSESKSIAVAITGKRCPPLKPKCVIESQKPFRIIIATDSDWLGEYMVTNNGYRGHTELGANWIDWLTQENALISIRGKGKSVRQLTFDSDNHRNLVQYINIAGLPLILVALGIWRYIYRKSMNRRSYSNES